MLAEDVLMLLHHPETGRPMVSSQKTDLAMGGALMVELIERRRIALSEPQQMTRNRRVVVTDASPTGDEVLDEALQRVAAQRSARAHVVVSKVVKGLSTRLLERLADQDVLRSEQAKLVGIIRVGAWPAVDLRHAGELRGGLRQVLVDQRAPTHHEAATIALLHAVGATKVLDDDGLPHSELRRRIAAIADGHPVGQVVEQALKATAF